MLLCPFKRGGALSLARRLGVMESVESDEHREKDDKEVDKDSLQTSECRERNSVEESKKDSESAGTGNTDSPETIDKHKARTVQTRKSQR